MNRFVVAGSMLCTGCHTCEAACSETHCQHDLQSMPRLRAMLNEEEPAPQLCHHCEDTSYAVVRSVNAITRADGVVRSNESLCMSCKPCGTAYPLGAAGFSGSRPLDIPVNVNTPKVPPALPVPAHISTLFNQVPDIRVIAVKCDLCSFDEQGPTCMRMCPTKALHLVDSTGTACANKRKRELASNTGFGDLTLFQQAQSGGVR